MTIVLLIILGLGVGFFQAVLGFGGGTLIVPLLDLIVDIDIKHIIATSLFVICLTAFANIISYHRLNLISWSIGIRIAAFTLIGSLISSQVNHFLSSETIHIILILLYFCLIVLSLIPYHWIPRFIKEVNLRNKIIMGLSAGVLSSLTGIGGGTFIVPIFLAGRWMEPSKVPGTANIVNFTSSLISFIGLEFVLWENGIAKWHSNSMIQWQTGLIIFVGAFISSRLLRKWQKGLTEVTKKKMIAVILGFLFLKLIGNLL